MGPPALPRALVNEHVKARQGNSSRGFPGDPGVETLGSQHGECGFRAQSGTESPHAPGAESLRSEKKRKKSLIILPPGGQGTKGGEIGFLA